MADSLTLHIGQPKAASTSLQHALTAQRVNLAAHGITYPLAPGKVNHNGEVSDFVLTHTGGGAGFTLGQAALAREEAWPGAWADLREAVHAARGRVLLSSEGFCHMSPAMAQRAVSELRRDQADDVRIVAVVRPVSGLLPSTYSQIALDRRLPGFEVWVRAVLASLLRGSAAEGGMAWLDSAWLASAWSPLGDLAWVRWGSEPGDRFEDELVDALDIRDVVERPLLGRRNEALPAALLLSWQQLLASSGEGTISPPERRRVLKTVHAELGHLPGGGGRLALEPAAADAIDRAFPLPGSTTPDREEAWATLAGMLGARSRLTVVDGVDDAQLRDGVARCAEQMRAGALREVPSGADA